MSWSIDDFLDRELMAKVMNGDYGALKASVDASNTAIRMSVVTPMPPSETPESDATQHSQEHESRPPT